MIRLNFRRGSAFASKQIRQYLETINVEDVKHIIVIRHAAIGDFMVIRPFLIQLKKFFHIVDKYNPNDKNKKVSFLYRIHQAKTLPEADFLFDLTDSSLSLLLTIFAKSKIKFGYSYRSIRRMFYDMAVLRSDFVLESDSALHMLNMLGNKSIELDYGLTNTYKKNIKKRIVYFAGASIKEKCWEESKYRDCIIKSSDEYKDYEHVILQGIKDDEKFLNIYETLEDKQNIILKTPMELDEVMQYLSDSSLVVSNDTGIRNMAIAVETPTVGIFFLTGAFRYWPRNQKHECVFNLEYTSPDVEDVYLAIKKVISRVYE